MSTSNCIVCGLPLTEHTSVSEGIGPVCREKAIMSNNLNEVVKHLPGQHTQRSHGRRAAGGVDAAQDATSVSAPMPTNDPAKAKKSGGMVTGDEISFNRKGGRRPGKVIGVREDGRLDVAGSDGKKYIVDASRKRTKVQLERSVAEGKSGKEAEPRGSETGKKDPYGASPGQQSDISRMAVGLEPEHMKKGAFTGETRQFIDAQVRKGQNLSLLKDTVDKHKDDPVYGKGKKAQKNVIANIAGANVTGDGEPAGNPKFEKDGTIKLSQHYFYAHGNTPEKWGEKARQNLTKAGFQDVEVVKTQDKYETWPKSSYFQAWVRIPGVNQPKAGPKPKTPRSKTGLRLFPPRKR